MTREALVATGVAVLLLGAVLLAVLAVRGLRKRLRARRAARRVEAALAGVPRTDETVSLPLAVARALEAELARVLVEVRESGRSGARDPAYAAPWYLVLGEAGAGTRTALRATGTPFTEPSATGAGACACWLSPEALLLATDGRFGGSDDEEREGWLALLDVLRRTRPRRPLDGVVLMLCVSTLMQGESAAIEGTAQRLRARLRALTTRLGMVVPVYLVLTQLDRLPGFMETFGDLGRAAKRQTWGFTLPSVARGAARDALVEERFARLVQVVERGAVTRVGEVETLEARGLVHALPTTLAGLAAPLRQLIARLFVDDPAHDGPIARGVYLTSVPPPRAPTPASPLGPLAEAPASARDERDEPRAGFFLGTLFPDVVLPDVRLATASRAVRRRRRVLLLASALAFSLLGASVAYLPALAYGHNRRLLVDLGAALARLPSAEPGHSRALTALDPLRDVARTLHAHAQVGVPRWFGLGLYRGHLLRGDVIALYVSHLRRLLIAAHVRRTAGALDALSEVQPTRDQSSSGSLHARAYELLKAYLLLTRDEGARAAQVGSHAAWLADHLMNALTGELEPEQGTQAAHALREQLRAHVDTYVALLADRPTLAAPRDAGVVTRARALLARTPAEALALDRIEARLEPLGLALSLPSLIGATGLPITTSHSVRGAYTRQGWETHVRALLEAPTAELLGEAWVLAGEHSLAGQRSDEDRRCALRAAYFARYIESWRQFLASVRVVPPADNAQALAMLQALTRGEPPPLEQLAQEVARHAQLDERPASDARHEERGLLKQLVQTLGSAAGSPRESEHAACLNSGQLAPGSVRAALRGFYTFGVGEPPPKAADANAGSPLTGARLYHEQLAFLRDALQAYAQDPVDAEPLLERLERASSSTRQLIDAQEVGWRPQFESLLWPLIQGTRATSGGDLARAKSMAWCGTVVSSFDRTLRNRYPFARAGQDAAIADVEAFYRYEGGALWSFYDASLARDVLRTGDRYAPRASSPLGRTYKAQLPMFLERSQAITRALFPSKESARVDLEVRVRPTPGIASVSLTVDGQVLDFRDGVERWLPLRWPGQGDVRGAQLRVRGVGIDERLGQEGEWGLFRLLESGSPLDNAEQRVVSVRFALRTQSDVVLDVRATRADSPLVGATGRMLEPFRAHGVEPPRELARGARACR